MKLNDCRLYCGDDEMQFSVFSNAVCLARYLESISLPFGDLRVDVYAIEPSSRSRWVITVQKEGEYSGCKCFLRKGDNFVECASQAIPNKLTAEILLKFPHLADQSRLKVA
jgi:hypothetical protein